jgi:hypothetical protein
MCMSKSQTLTEGWPGLKVTEAPGVSLHNKIWKVTRLKSNKQERQYCCAIFFFEERLGSRSSATVVS